MSQLTGPTVTALLAVRLAGESLDDVLDRLVHIAKEALEVDDVSITLVRREKPWTAAYTGQLALDADEMQYERGYGPCIDAGISGTVLRIDDMRADTPWPDYAANVVPRGVLSSMSMPLPLQTDVVGALNCYAREPRAFAPEAQGERAAELADHVAVAVANAVAYADTAALAEQMHQAMSTRGVIEQAKGVIMAQNRCSAEAAFEILRKASMGRNVKLRDIAAALVESVSGRADGQVPQA